MRPALSIPKFTARPRQPAPNQPAIALVATLEIPCFLRPKQNNAATVPPLMRRAIGALRHDYEVRLFSKGELCILYAAFFSRDQVHTITEYKSYLDIRAAQCSVVWLIKQKEKQS